MFIKLAAFITALVALETLKHVSKYHILMFRIQAGSGTGNWVEEIKDEIEKMPVFRRIKCGQILIGVAYFFDSYLGFKMYLVRRLGDARDILHEHVQIDSTQPLSN